MHQSSLLYYIYEVPDKYQLHEAKLDNLYNHKVVHLCLPSHQEVDLTEWIKMTMAIVYRYAHKGLKNVVVVDLSSDRSWAHGRTCSCAG